MQEEQTAGVFSSLIGTRETVLVTGASKRNARQLTGKSSRNISINFEGSDDLIGRIVPVVITAASKTTLKGEIWKGE